MEVKIKEVKRFETLLRKLRTEKLKYEELDEFKSLCARFLYKATAVGYTDGFTLI